MSNTIGDEKSANSIQNPAQSRPKGQQNDQFLKMLPSPPSPTLLSRIGQAFQASKGEHAQHRPGDVQKHHPAAGTVYPAWQPPQAWQAAGETGTLQTRCGSPYQDRLTIAAWSMLGLILCRLSFILCSTGSILCISGPILCIPGPILCSSGPDLVQCKP